MDRMRIKMPMPSTAERRYELIFSKRMFPGNRGDGWNVLVGHTLIGNQCTNATQRICGWLQ